jgi:periplasmic protein TonB
MFEHTLIETQHKFRTHRKATTLVSLLLEALLVGVFVLVPLIFTQALPTEKLVTALVAPPPPPPPPPPPSAAKVEPSAPKPVTKADISPDEIRVPTKIPTKVVETQEQASAAAPSVAGVVGGVPGGVAGGQTGGVIGGVLGSVPTAVPKMEAPQRVRVSGGVVQGLLVHQVKPEYPPPARTAHIEGQVVLHAVIGKDGGVKQVQVLSGHPMLASAAQNAVKQWRYRPYVLNGQPVEVDTTINVNFTMAG